MIHNYVINTEYICIIELPLDIDRTLSLSLVTSVGWTKQQVEDFNYFSQYQWSNVISKNKHFLLSSSPTGLSLPMILKFSIERFLSTHCNF